MSKIEEKDKGILHQVMFSTLMCTCTVYDFGYMFQITSTKAAIEKSYYRIDVIERLLAAQDMAEERRAELAALKQILRQSEQEIETLHFANRATTKIAAAVMFGIVFIFCIYAIISNDN